MICAVGNESVELEWTANGSQETNPEKRANCVKFFTVQHCIAESEVWTSCAVVADCHCRVQHLIPGQMYSFRIIAHGEGSTRSDPSGPSEPLIIPPDSPFMPKTPTLCSSVMELFPSPGDSGDTDKINSSTLSLASSQESQQCTRGKQQFHEKYVELEDLARGRFSVIRRCQDVSTGRELAVKFIHRKRWKKQLIVKEYQILSAISHGSIVECLELCETLSYTAIVMEWYVVETIELFAWRILFS